MNEPGARKALLVGTWGARTSDELLAAFRGAGAAASDVIELRLDLPRDGAARAKELVAASPKPVIATCRRGAEGGGFTAGERDRIDVLLRAADAGAAWLDVEDDVPDRDVERLAGTGAKLLRSLHVERLGPDAAAVVERLLGLRGDAAKFVALHGKAADALAMLTFVRDAAGRLAGHVADVPFTRPASAALGAPFVYAALQPGGRIGVPMPTVLTLRRRDRFDRLLPGTPLFVLIGGNVEGSVSPQMLNAAFEATGSEIVDLRWSCDDPGPPLEAIRRFGWAGAAVTTPHKVAVYEPMELEGRLGPTAEDVNAVNTVIRKDGRLVGHNTDMGGLEDALAPHVDLPEHASRPVLVLGDGGAAKAAHALADHRSWRTVGFARSEYAAAMVGFGFAASAEEAAAERPAVVVDATPAGPPGGEPFFDPSRLPERAVVLHMLVHARPTALLAAAARAGHVTIHGLAMLAAQAARQVVMLGGPSPDREAMRSVGAAWLNRRDAPIVLVGLRCAGKTTVGERLAAILDRPFLDTDREVERRTGRSVEAMLQAGDETAFRAAEDEVLRAAIDVPGAVIACAGGAALHRDAFAALAAWGDVVLLDAPDEVLLARRAGSPRTPLTPLAPGDELARQRAERMPVYRAAARLVVDVATLDAEAAADEIAAWWDALPPEHWSDRASGAA